MPRKKTKRNGRERGQGSIREVRPGVFRAWRAPEDGKRPSQTFAGPDAFGRAERWLAGIVFAAPITVGRYLEKWYTARHPSLSPQTRSGYEAAIGHLEAMAERPLLDVNHLEWQAWLGQLLVAGTVCWRWEGKGQHRHRVPTGERRPMAISSVQQIRSVLSIALNDAVPDYLPDNPLKRTRLPKAPPAKVKAWARREIGLLLQTACTTRDEAMYHVGLAVGPRLGELRELRWPDLDERTGALSISRSLSDDGKTVGPTKNRSNRTVQLAPETLAMLLEHQKRQPAGQQLMFGGPERSYSAVEYRRMLSAICKRAGITRLSIHALRHTAASIQLAAGVSPPEVARMLGHTLAVLLKVYGHFIQDDSSRSVAAARAALYGSGTESGTSARDLHAAG